MRYVIIAAYCLMVIGLILVGYGFAKAQEVYQAPLTQSAPLPLLDSYKTYILVNNYRASQNIKKLKWNPDMCEFTKKRLLEIQTDWSHSGFDSMSTNKHPYPYIYAGENLGRGFDDEQSQLAAWITSSSHLKNIVNPQYTDTCIAADAAYSVQEFASF